MKPTVALLPMLALAVAACGPAISSAAFTQAAPRPPNHEIQLYSTKLPTCAYEELGVVRAKRRGFFSSLQDVLAALQERAREMGGDAIVGVGQTQTVHSGVTVDNVMSVNTQEGLAGTVVRFTQPDCRQ